MKFELQTSPARGLGAWLNEWMISAVSLALLSRWLDCLRLPPDFREALLAVLGTAALLGLLNLSLKPLLILLTLPISVLSLGLFLLVINGAVLALACSLVPGMSRPSLWQATGAALAYSGLRLLLRALLGGLRFSLRVGRGG